MVKMKYIIMCGGNYDGWKKPRQLSLINGEVLIERTIRLLKENGITDIAISTNNHEVDCLGLPILNHENNYKVESGKIVDGGWYNAFYPIKEPACYIFGDVYFSPDAIKTIIETQVDDIELFGSKKPFNRYYMKTHEEPFALKVANQKHLREAIQKTHELDIQGKFWRKPIVWELFTVIKNAPLQVRRDEYTTDYIGISDYTVDIDRPEDVMKLNEIIGGMKMIKCETIKEFTLERYDELENIQRKSIDTKGKLYVGDVFECKKELADYLLGGNDKGKVVVKVIEIEPEKQIEQPKIIVVKNTTTTMFDPSIPTTKGIETKATYKSTYKKTKKSKKSVE